MISLLANHWASRGEQVTLITIDTSASDSYPLDPRVRRRSLGMMEDSTGLLDALANNWRRIVALRAAIRATDATVALSFGEHANVQTVLATRFSEVRCVISERTDPARHYIGKAWRMLRRMVYPMADAMVVQTRSLLPWARSFVGKNRAYVIPNPVRDVRHIQGVQGEHRGETILAAGRLVPAKGFDVLLEAFAEVARELPQCTLLILGEGPERAALSKLAETLGVRDKVRLIGRVAEPAELMQIASLFVLSSRYEGFPNALLEAMACGLPVISTACRGSREIITHEVDGFLVPECSASQLSAAILKLIKDRSLRTELGRNARAVCTRSAMESVADRWAAVLSGSVSHPGAALRDQAASSP